ncbi:MAG: hypothetical protein LBE21_02140, partial [Pseudomonadales bacterium]|nr:hypothetical protein [Pseudomonadales bacterium]
MTDTPVLTGPDLDDLLDRLETDLEEDAMQAAGLAAQLRAQPLRADSLDAVERLQALWMQAGDATAARAVIDNDGARVLDAAPPPEHATIRMTLALCRLAIARELRDDSALCAELETLRAIVR